MKNLLFALTGTFFVCCSAPKMEKVGIAFSTRPDVLNSVGLREKWNALLENKLDSVRVNPVIIRRSVDEENNQPYYFLFAQTEDSHLKMAQLLYRENRDLFVDVKEPEIVICNCEDYSPRRVNGKWICYSAEGGEECEIEVILDGKNRLATKSASANNPIKITEKM